MSETSPILSLPYLMPSQAQKHVTHNEALQILDAVVQLRVTAFDAETPPADPTPGAAWALGGTPTGAWAGQAGRLAIWQGEGWLFLEPLPGWRAWGLTEEESRIWDGSAWILPPHLGINTSADASNRLAVSGPATLLTHEGAGHQLKINKASSGDTGALLFQSNWSGRAEMGLLGNNDFTIKVSSDGSSWAEAIRVTADSGTVHGQAGHFTGLTLGEGQAGDTPLSLYSSAANCYLSLNDTATSSNGSVAVLATGDTLKLRAGGSNAVNVLPGGKVGIGTASPLASFHVEGAGASGVNADVLELHATSASFTRYMAHLKAARTASSNFHFLVCQASDGTDNVTLLRGDGTNTTDGSWGTSGADYAEYFEWLDGNPAGEDRRGISVVLEGDKIRPAAAGENPIGVISATPSVVGDGDIDRWKGKYLRDDFGAYLWEDHEIDGGLQQRRKLNPAYDPERPYTPRAQRGEWAMVGLMGKLRLRRTQPTAPRWIKMREVSSEVEEWLLL